jgi:hypothetical protein
MTTITMTTRTMATRTMTTMTTMTTTMETAMTVLNPATTLGRVLRKIKTKEKGRKQKRSRNPHEC